MKLPSSFFSIRLVSIYVVHPYSSFDTILALKNFYFIGQVWLPYDQSRTVNAFASHVLMSFYQLIRRCFWGRWIYPRVSENHHLVWRRRLFDFQTSIDLMKENGFTLAKERSRRYPAQTISEADYADDIALLANTPTQAESLLYSLERAAGGIDLKIIYITLASGGV